MAKFSIMRSVDSNIWQCLVNVKLLLCKTKEYFACDLILKGINVKNFATIFFNILVEYT